jgi:hypothetical protein
MCCMSNGENRAKDAAQGGEAKTNVWLFAARGGMVLLHLNSHAHFREIIICAHALHCN